MSNTTSTRVPITVQTRRAAQELFDRTQVAEGVALVSLADLRRLCTAAQHLVIADIEQHCRPESSST